MSRLRGRYKKSAGSFPISAAGAASPSPGHHDHRGPIPDPVVAHYTAAMERLYAIDIDVATRYLDDQSEPEQDRYVFAYTIRIRNSGQVPARLLTRHWIITDANGKTEEVEGDGVVGEQPYLRPGEDFEYTSGAVLETDLGTMRGDYQMLADDGTRFAAPIPAFTLTIPRTLH
jgi:ApaG protein